MQTTGSFVADLDFKAGGGLILVDQSATAIGFYGHAAVARPTAMSPVNLTAVMGAPMPPVADPSFDPELDARLGQLEATVNLLVTALTDLGLVG